MSAPDPATLQTAIDRSEIGQVLTRYCHGIDRCNADVLASAYWPDATDNHGSGAEPVADFIASVISALKAMTSTMHSISNIMIELNGDSAKVETYCTAYHQLPATDDAPAIEMIVGGRYLDRMEKRGQEWRIVERTYVMDWNRNDASSQELEDGVYATLQVRGARHPDDPWDGFGGTEND